jgi:hypothetical protein
MSASKPTQVTGAGTTWRDGLWLWEYSVRAPTASTNTGIRTASSLRNITGLHHCLKDAGTPGTRRQPRTPSLLEAQPIPEHATDTRAVRTGCLIEPLVALVRTQPTVVTPCDAKDHPALARFSTNAGTHRRAVSFAPLWGLAEGTRMVGTGSEENEQDDSPGSGPRGLQSSTGSHGCPPRVDRQRRWRVAQQLLLCQARFDGDHTVWARLRVCRDGTEGTLTARTMCVSSGPAARTSTPLFS